MPVTERRATRQTGQLTKAAKGVARRGEARQGEARRGRVDPSASGGWRSQLRDLVSDPSLIHPFLSFSDDVKRLGEGGRGGVRGGVGKS